MKTTALLTTSIGQYPKRSGKVRDIYELPDSLLLVATDRISAYDVVMPNGIPDKGRVLTQISLFWFELLKEVTPNHVISSSIKDLPEGADKEELEGRFMLCRKAKVVPIECVVRGYLAGSGWKEYQKSGTACGIALPPRLKQCSKLPEPIFTPASKAETGHDENIDFETACGIVGEELMTELRRRSIALYVRARDYAAEKGIIVADTKFEWGTTPDGEILLIDECLTPDSSRFWPVEGYVEGGNPPSYDKQFVRDWLERATVDGQPWNKTAPAPALDAEVIHRTAAKYQEAMQRLVG